jgi:hypothetical protein
VVENEPGTYQRLIDFLSLGSSTPPRPALADPRFGLEDMPFARNLRFAPDGKAVAYSIQENSVDNIWLQPLDGSAPRALTHFFSARTTSFNFLARWQVPGFGARPSRFGGRAAAPGRNPG